MTDRILFVDDEPAVLDGYKRTLHRDFEVDTAVGGEAGLASFGDRGPYSVVISDMRMPGMNGAEFLAQVRQSAPDTVRMLLTGFTDLIYASRGMNPTAPRAWMFPDTALTRYLQQLGHPCRIGSISPGHGREGTPGKDSHGEHQGADRRLERSEPRGLRQIHANHAVCSASGCQAQSLFSVAL